MRTTLTALLLFLATGCGGSSPTSIDLGGEDGREIAVLVEDLNDAKGNPKKTAGLFAAGAKPPDPKKLNQYEFSIVGKPSVSGESATCKVRVDNAKGETAGEPEWSFVKDGGKWKIKDAPLP
jgi:hypothetical protein